MNDMWKELKQLRLQQESIGDMVQLGLGHVCRIEQTLLPLAMPEFQHMLPPPTTPASQHPLPPIQDEPSHWEYSFIPPTTPVAPQHAPPRRVLSPTVPEAPQNKLSAPKPVAQYPQPSIPLQPVETPVPSQHTPSQPVLSPTVPVAPQKKLSAPKPVPQYPQPSIPLQPVEMPVKESSATVPSHDLRFTPSFLASIRAGICSRLNFSVNMVHSLFSLEERKASNVGGKLGKKQLDPQRIIRIKEATFQTYPKV